MAQASPLNKFFRFRYTEIQRNEFKLSGQTLLCYPEIAKRYQDLLKHFLP